MLKGPVSSDTKSIQGCCFFTHRPGRSASGRLHGDFQISQPMLGSDLEPCRIPQDQLDTREQHLEEQQKWVDPDAPNRKMMTR